MKKSLALVLTLVMLLTLVPAVAETVAQPEGYPKGVISWIVPSSAGGSIDMFTRALGNAGLGGNVVVENISGGSQSIGMTEVVNRPADGQTLISLASTGLITMPLTTEVQYSTDSFRYLNRISPDTYGVAVVKAGSPLAEGDALWEKLNKGETYDVAVSSIGGHSYIAFAKALHQIGHFKDANFVVYKGSNGVMQAILSGEVEFGLLDDTYLKAYLENKEIEAAMTLHAGRSALLPDTPSLGEYGIEGLEPLGGVKIVAVRKETPEPIADWIKQQINLALASQEYEEFLINSGAGKLDKIATEEEITQWVKNAVEVWDEVLTMCELK